MFSSSSSTGINDDNAIYDCRSTERERLQFWIKTYTWLCPGKAISAKSISFPSAEQNITPLPLHLHQKAVEGHLTAPRHQSATTEAGPLNPRISALTPWSAVMMQEAASRRWGQLTFQEKLGPATDRQLITGVTKFYNPEARQHFCWNLLPAYLNNIHERCMVTVWGVKGDLHLGFSIILPASQQQKSPDAGKAPPHHHQHGCQLSSGPDRAHRFPSAPVPPSCSFVRDGCRNASSHRSQRVRLKSRSLADCAKRHKPRCLPCPSRKPACRAAAELLWTPSSNVPK